MSPSPQGYNNEALPFIAQDHERRIQALEREKLATEVALIKRDVADIKTDVALIKTNQDTQRAESNRRQGGQASWKAVWIYVVGGLVAVAAIASPFITLATQ